MALIIQIVALLATIVVAIGYLPQIVHLWKEHCSAGISISAWVCWVLASILFYSHAISIMDPVFITLLSVQLIAQLAIVALTRKYQGMA